MTRFERVATAVLSLICLSACTNDSGDSPLSPAGVGPLTIEHITTSVISDEVNGVRRPGAAPTPSGGPNITATANEVVLTGGTQTIAIDADAPFSAVYLFVAGQSLGIIGEGGGGISGYYEVQLPDSETATNLLLTYPQEVPLTEFDLQVAVASPSGAIGPFVPLHTRVLGVGTGDVQVTLAWDVDSDVDLHVVGPDGEEIFYGNRSSNSGGELDLDSNAACDIDGVRNENITWPVGTAPQGTYTVRVNYWSNCDVQQTNYTVRINNGGAVQLFTGTFTGSGNGGGLGAGRLITTFERTAGPAAIMAPVQLVPGAPGRMVTPFSGKVRR